MLTSWLDTSRHWLSGARGIRVADPRRDKLSRDFAAETPWTQGHGRNTLVRLRR
jgi:hypothetical protein